MGINIISAGLKFNSSLARRKSTVRLIIHHAAAPSASVETIHKWHLGRGWAGIGYNFYVRRDGSVYQGRGWDTVGAHCAGFNSTSVGICFEGNYETEQDMPKVQYNAGVELMAETLRRYPTITEICGHKAHGSTACPGRYFPLGAMISAAKGGHGDVSVDSGSQIDPGYNDHVRDLQEAFNLDGIRDNKGRILELDGIKGPNTTAAAKKTVLRAGAYIKDRYKVGSTGAVVLWVQHRLNEVMGCGLAEDKKYGNDTQAMVCEWQRRCGLTVDGKVGIDTITSLL